MLTAFIVGFGLVGVVIVIAVTLPNNSAPDGEDLTRRKSISKGNRATESTI